ncbi:MAG: hypothetical protein JSR97_13470 [Verrucomicrobia bacterium]|nr:hypothetical protein [Verrucomicrobiota bacterium]
MSIKFSLAFCFFVIAGCSSSTNDSSSEKTSEDDYENGKYCAEVTYYNPNTGTKKTYTLNVEVENRELTRIYWPNGGWLDDSHFNPPNIANDGTCSFSSDKGYDYQVSITGRECSFTSQNVVTEGEDEPRKFTLTIEQCASTMKMTEEELSEYETTFTVSRTDIISEEMCRLMFEYLQKHRELTGRRNSLTNLMENGYIQKRYSTGSEDNIRCQTVIVKRKGHFYLMEVQGTRATTMGLMDFNPSIEEWQEVKILEDPANPVWNVFIMRIINESSEMSILGHQMEAFCN